MSLGARVQLGYLRAPARTNPSTYWLHFWGVLSCPCWRAPASARHRCSAATLASQFWATPILARQCASTIPQATSVRPPLPRGALSVKDRCQARKISHARSQCRTRIVSDRPEAWLRVRHVRHTAADIRRTSSRSLAGGLVGGAGQSALVRQDCGPRVARSDQAIKLKYGFVAAKEMRSDTS